MPGKQCDFLRRHAHSRPASLARRRIESEFKIDLATGLIVGYGYMMEAFTAWYSASEYEGFMMKNRIWTGPYWWAYALLLLCNILVPQILWSRRARHSTVVLFVVAMFVNVGMWLERFVIIVTSLHRDFLPSSWAMYRPTIFDFSMLFGTIGMFLTLLFLFMRFLPIISIFEMRTLVPGAVVKEENA